MYANTTPVHADSMAKKLRLLTRVRKLLRLARDQDGLPEGDAARARAREMMARHGLEAHQVQVGGEGAADFIHRQFDLGQHEGWRRALVDAIAEYFDCVALYEKDADVVETYGPAHCLPQVEYTFTVYLRELVTRWRSHVEDLREEALWASLSRRQQLEHREVFCTSYVMGVRDRLKEDRRTEADDDPSSAASAAHQRRELERWMRRAGVRWRARPGRIHGYSDAGYTAGHSVDVDPALRPGAVRRKITG
ncbi:MAG: DUF7168 domain-containing protein [Myxococcota bacterium]